MISIENAEHYTWGDACDGWHLVKTDALSVIREKMPSGASEVRHFHEKSNQFFYVLKGTATIEAGGARQILKSGEGIEVGRGVPHQMFNESADDLEFLVVSCPPSHGDRKLL